MIELLARRLIRDHDHVNDPAVRRAYGVLCGCAGIALNLLLFAGKCLAGLISGSIAITADAFNNLSDAGASVVTLLGFKLAAQRPDRDHPFGHGRMEYVSGLVVSMVILLMGVELAKTSVEKILEPQPVEFSPLVAVILAVSIAVKLYMSHYNRAIGRKIGSAAMAATAADSLSDSLATTAVLLSTLAGHFWNVNIDGWCGAAVACFILWAGVKAAKETIDPLLGQPPSPEFVSQIQEIVLRHREITGIHDLMVHDYGPGRQFASVHVELAAEGDVMASHELIDDIERDFLKNDRLPVVIHFDPIVTSDAQVGDMRRWLAEAVKTIDPSLSIHDLRMVPGVNHTNVIFDCVTPPGFAMSSARLKDAIARLVSEKDPSYRCVITVETSFAAVPRTGETVQ